MDRDKSKVVGSNLWYTLLSDASAATTTSVFSSEKSIIVLGNDLSGKSVLVSKLQGLEDPHRGSALDFQVIDIQDEDIDENGLCRLWVVDGHLTYRSLLQFALPPTMLNHSVVIMTVDMSQPWTLLDTIDKWKKVLYEHIDSLKISHVELAKLKQKLVDDFLTYVDPSDGKADGKLALSKTSEEAFVMGSEDLGNIALSENHGIPIIVVCTKCDHFENLEAEYDYREEHFDYMQYILRLQCLKLGAALVFTSMKENKNIEVLKKYILHKLYGFPFVMTASVVDRDAVFVPIGWDSDKKIGIIKDSLTKLSISDPFTSIISRPPSTRMFSQDTKEQVVEDEQTFLIRAQNVLTKAPGLPKANESSSIHSSKYRQPQEGPISFTPTSSTKVKHDPNKSGANNERMLANFFNSLLNKKSGSPSVTNSLKTGRKSTDHQQETKTKDLQSS